mgnify:CR=1 FL=1
MNLIKLVSRVVEMKNAHARKVQALRVREECARWEVSIPPWADPLYGIRAEKPCTDPDWGNFSNLGF